VVADGFRIDAAWLDALDSYVEGLMEDTMEVANSTTEFARDAIISYAKTKPNWVGLADGIQRWSEDGQVIIGVQGREMVSQAMALEYGDIEHPPDSLFRTLDQVGVQARDHFAQEMMARRPIVIPGVKV
jgi:hypothetical protein